MTPDQPITIELVQVPPPETSIQPSAPLVLCSPSFINTLKKVDAEARALTITTPAESQLAASLLVRLTGAGTALEKQRVDLKAPYLAYGKAIDDAAKPVAENVKYLKTLLSTKQGIWMEEERRKAAQAERDRQRQLAELEAKQKKETDEAARLKAEQEAKWAAEAEAKGATGGIDLGEEDAPPAPVVAVVSETQQQIAALKAAPVAKVAAPAGTREVVTLVFRVKDVFQLADIFVERIPRMDVIRTAYCKGWKKGDAIPVVGGLEFEVQTSIQSTGRAEF